MPTLAARMTNPAFAVPDAMEALQALAKSISRARVPIDLELLNMRASQINGCSVCLDGHVKAARKGGESEERLATVAAWRDAPYFTDAERAALELTEALTRLADTTEPVSDDLWDRVSEHFDEQTLAAIIMAIGLINVWNRLNISTRQVAGAEW